MQACVDWDLMIFGTKVIEKMVALTHVSPSSDYDLVKENISEYALSVLCNYRLLTIFQSVTLYLNEPIKFAQFQKLYNQTICN